MSINAKRRKLHVLIGITAVASLSLGIATGAPAMADDQDAPVKRVVVNSEYEFAGDDEATTQSSKSDTSLVEIESAAKEIPDELLPPEGESVKVEYTNATSLITTQAAKCSNQVAASKPKKSNGRETAQAEYSRSKGCSGTLSAAGTSSYKSLGLWAEATTMNGTEGVKPGTTKTMRWNVKCKNSKTKTWANTATMGSAGEDASARSASVKLSCSP